MDYLSLCQIVIVVITCELGQTDGQILGVAGRVGADKSMPAGCCHQICHLAAPLPLWEAAGDEGVEDKIILLQPWLVSAGGFAHVLGCRGDGGGSSQLAVGPHVCSSVPAVVMRF